MFANIVFSQIFHKSDGWKIRFIDLRHMNNEGISYAAYLEFQGWTVPVAI